MAIYRVKDALNATKGIVFHTQETQTAFNKVLSCASACLEILEQECPYPEDIFTPIKKEEWPIIHKALNDAGIIPDRLSAEIGRQVWKAFKSEVKEVIGNG